MTPASVMARRAASALRCLAVVGSISAAYGVGLDVHVSPAAAPEVKWPDVKWKAPALFVEGQPFIVHVALTSAEPVPAWMFNASAFTFDGQALQARKKTELVKLDKGLREFDYDLGGVLDGKVAKERAFELGYGEIGASVSIRVAQLVERSANFLDEKKFPAAELARLRVLLATTDGTMEIELWPDVAPSHVRNFLDLCTSGFYTGVGFHRVQPGFMAQSGDPNTKSNQRATWGSGGGPRTVRHEFSDHKHVRGVVSMARGDDPDSASSQFFLVHGDSPALDGKYSAFGRIVDGLAVLDAIVAARGTASPTDGTIQPAALPRIQRGLVVRLAAEAADSSEKPDKPIKPGKK